MPEFPLSTGARNCGNTATTSRWVGVLWVREEPSLKAGWDLNPGRCDACAAHDAQLSTRFHPADCLTQKEPPVER